MDSFVQTLII